MATDQFTPGPIHLFGTIGTQTPAYLGTCVAAPEQEGEKFKIPIMNDLGGRSVPFQLVQDGETWMVMATMNRFNISNIYTLLARESGIPGTAATVPGVETGASRGTLYIGVSDWQLVLVNGYAGTTSAGTTPANLPGGRLYYSANIRKYKESTVGTRVLEVAMAIELQNVFNPTTRGFSLYKNLTAAEAAQYMSLVS